MAKISTPVNFNTILTIDIDEESLQREVNIKVETWMDNNKERIHETAANLTKAFIAAEMEILIQRKINHIVDLAIDEVISVATIKKAVKAALSEAVTAAIANATKI